MDIVYENIVEIFDLNYQWKICLCRSEMFTTFLEKFGRGSIIVWKITATHCRNKLDLEDISSDSTFYIIDN